MCVSVSGGKAESLGRVSWFREVKAEVRMLYSLGGEVTMPAVDAVHFK